MEKRLIQIVDELSRLNKNFEKMIAVMERTKRKMIETNLPCLGPAFGSEGETKKSEK